MTQTSTNEKTEALQSTEGTEMLERFWTEIRAEIDSINIVCLVKTIQYLIDRILFYV